MKTLILIALIGLSLCFFEQRDDSPFVTEENLKALKHTSSFETYTYEEHPFKNWTVSEVKKLMGMKKLLDWSSNTETEEVADDIPTEFDGRQKWPNCIHAIRDQGHCGSCWAFAASEVLSDRFCIKSEGAVNVVLSPEDMVSCDYFDHGCNGGVPVLSWTYLKFFGVVTEECKPYTSMDGKVDSCKFFTKKCRAENVEYKKYKAESFSMHPTVNSIKKALLEGPVETGFQVYEDFMSYKSGIYVHSSGKHLGGHAVKIVGYGKDAAVGDYWIVANSWGTQWGDNGFFKIKSGQCGFEGMAISGTPALN